MKFKFFTLLLLLKSFTSAINSNYFYLGANFGTGDFTSKSLKTINTNVKKPFAFNSDTSISDYSKATLGFIHQTSLLGAEISFARFSLNPENSFGSSILVGPLIRFSIDPFYDSTVSNEDAYFWLTAKTGLAFININAVSIQQNRLFYALRFQVKVTQWCFLSLDWENNHIYKDNPSLSAGFQIVFK